jgi:hypothetical protein
VLAAETKSVDCRCSPSFDLVCATIRHRDSDDLAIVREIFPVGACMRRLVARTVTCLVFLAFACWANAEPGEKRIALVIGNAAYQSGGLATAANDAGLIAQTLQAAGFDVVGAREVGRRSAFCPRWGPR